MNEVNEGTGGARRKALKMAVIGLAALLPVGVTRAGPSPNPCPQFDLLRRLRNAF